MRRMTTATALTVGEVARLAGVTVRTLHHYDELGLVTPGQRTDAGYRLYGDAEVARLQEVLFFRELGFPLDEIGRIIGDPSYERASALTRQRELLVAKAVRLQRMIRAVDAALDAEHEGYDMTPEEKLEVFGDFDPSDYEDEARERWGDTDAYQQSAARTARYSKDDWLAIKAEAEEIDQAFLALMSDGVDAGSKAAMDVAERHRSHISRWFYDCSREIHSGLGQMYVDDQRFKDNIDKAGAGLAQYMSEAIAANAARA